MRTFPKGVGGRALLINSPIPLDHLKDIRKKLLNSACTGNATEDQSNYPCQFSYGHTGFC